MIFNWLFTVILYCINFFFHYSLQLAKKTRTTLNQSNLSFVLLFALKGALHAYFQLKGVLDPRFFLNTCDRKLLRVTWPDSCGDVRRLPSTFTWTLGKAVSVSWTPSTFFLFLFESSHVLPIDIYEVKSFLYNQSIWDARKLIFQPRFVFEMKDPHLLCNSRWRRTWWFFLS